VYIISKIFVKVGQATEERGGLQLYGHGTGDAGLVTPVVPLSTAVGCLESNDLVLRMISQLSKLLWRMQISQSA
jgi:hypothetical protein